MPVPPGGEPTGRGRLAWGVAAAGVAVLVAGLLAWLVQSPGGGVATPTVASVVRAPLTGTTAEPARAEWEPGAPRRVLIPALHVAAPVLPVRAPGGTLVPPSDPQQLGWWAGGARPGAARGSALITGHTVHTGGGALDHLEDLRRGDRVTVRTDRGRVAYAVRRVGVYSKGAVARQAARLFSQLVPGRLVLVTCERWDGERFLDNVVVTATPAAE